jgi:exopolyphosphatase / guanosine-5'-triphosphate,3'-diphosphate pyrophosphatase
MTTRFRRAHSTTPHLRSPSIISRVRVGHPAPLNRPCGPPGLPLVLSLVRRACIDIGSNTTRLLVADCDGERLREVHQERVFTQVRRGVRGDDTIAPEKITEVVAVVVGQACVARRLGCAAIYAVATAAIRRAANGEQLVAAIRDACGLEVKVLTEREEARLAFVGAARTLGHVPDGDLGVVDVGGGSSELVVGTAPDTVRWSTSFAVGSGDLADNCLRSDPPSEAELLDARVRVARALSGFDAPHPTEAVAVGGGAASLQRLAGPLLDSSAFSRSLALLTAERRADVARRFALDVERVRLLPAGLLILQGAAELFGASLQIARGGLREGVLLEASHA